MLSIGQKNFIDKWLADIGEDIGCENQEGGTPSENDFQKQNALLSALKSDQNLQDAVMLIRRLLRRARRENVDWKCAWDAHDWLERHNYGGSPFRIDDEEFS